jgi:hypothetical protein
VTEIPQSPASAGPPVAEASPSPAARAIAMFVRPAEAWSGLRTRAQWWFPLVVVLAFNTAWSLLLYPRAILPMVLENMEAQVADGQVPAEQFEAAERMMTSTAGMAFSIGSQAVTQALVLLLVAALVLFAVGFVMGVRFSYRLALEVTAWASLVKIPEYLVVGALAWSKGTLLGVHAGFGALLPEPETPSRLLTGLGHFLDALGPLAVWPVLVGVLGAAALSGAPRRSVAWVLLSLYAVLSLFGAAFTTLSMPGA